MATMWWRWWIGLAMIVSMLGGGSAAEAAEHKRVLLVLVNRLAEADMAQMPHLQQLAQLGARGLMNVHAGGKRTDANGYATLALGVPAQMEERALLAYNGDEQPQESAVAAMSAQGGAGVRVLSMPRLQSQVGQREYAGRVGSIGEQLRGHGLQAAVFGSSDRGTALWRPAALLTTDGQGHTPYGDVSPRLLTDAPERPFGVRTDYAAMWKQYEEVQGRASLAVFDLADLYRLHAYRSLLTEARFQELRQTVLAEIDTFLAKVGQEIGANTLVIAAAPQVNAIGADKQHLAPLVLAGGKTLAEQVLTSATTRRAGIVSNVDIAPTLLQFLGVSPEPGMIGYPLQSTNALAPAQIPALLERTVWTYTQRVNVLVLCGVVIGCGLLLALAKLVWQARVPGWLVRGLLWIALAMPVCLLLLPIWQPRTLWEAAGGLCALFLLVAGIPFRILWHTLTARILWLTAWTVGVVVADTWQGGWLARTSLFSYDPIVGARYYGVGNEYMGVVVGAVMLAFATLLGNRASAGTKWAGSLVLVGLLLTLFFASPMLGTNTGGALTMAGTTALVFAKARGWRSARMLLTVAGALCGAFGLLFLLNQTAGAPSHIGAAAHQVLHGGFEEMARILARKSDMFLRLFTATLGPAVILGLLGLFAWFLSSEPSLRSKWRTQQLGYWQVITGLLGGAVVGLCTNDSGVVVAGVILLFALFPSLLRWLEPEREALSAVERTRRAA